MVCIPCQKKKREFHTAVVNRDAAAAAQAVRDAVAINAEKLRNLKAQLPEFKLPWMTRRPPERRLPVPWPNHLR